MSMSCGEASEPIDVEMDTTQLSADSLHFARSYQLEALDAAIKKNTIVFLETGSGKTLIAIMLLRSYAYMLRKPSPFIAVFLVPQVVLVEQQAEAVQMHTDLKVGVYWGDMGVDYWDADMWKKQLEKYEVLVMTPAILLSNLRHSFFKLSMIKVLILDECHHARGNHPYACIMKDFFHRQLQSGVSELPRIFGMTASPIKSKGGVSESSYWKTIDELETIMNSKVYTCVSESVLSEYIPQSTPKFKYYRHESIPYSLYELITSQLNNLKEKHELSLKSLDLSQHKTDSISKKMMKFFSSITFCLDELGVWLALKAAWSFSHKETDLFSWEKLDVMGETIVRNFSSEAYQAFAYFLPSDPKWTIAGNVEHDLNMGLLTPKVVCLIQLLLKYRDFKDLRCIVFVQRVITSVVIESLLSAYLPKLNDWKVKYIAGNNSGVQSQTRKKQNEIVEEFRNGMVNIIVATSILEEGLDVQSCNLVIRFDPSSTVSSFIQSRGRARMQNSDYILMMKSGDSRTHSRIQNYLSSGDIMRKESLRHSSLPNTSLEIDLQDDGFYYVESTGASLTLASSIELVYFYCSRLPSDGYFKPAPRWEKETGTLLLPKSCPIPDVHVEGKFQILKQIACFEACKQLHKIGALTDNLVPDIVEEEGSQELGLEPYDDVQPSYVPIELVKTFCSSDAIITYHCYLIELNQNFEYDIPVHDIVLAMRSKLDSDIANMHFDLEVSRGTLAVNFKYVGEIQISSERVLFSRRFQTTIFRVLIDHNLNKLEEALSGLCLGETAGIDFLLLPGTRIHQRPAIIDWTCVTSVLFSCEEYSKGHQNCSLSNKSVVNTKNGAVCSCMIENSLVYTPHNGAIYCIIGLLGELNGNSLLHLRDGSALTYKKYYEVRHGINLRFGKQLLLKGRRLFQVQNYLQRCRQQTERESSRSSVELPPELCYIIMSPISVSSLYSFSFVPSIMHRLEALLIAANLKKIVLDDCPQDIIIPNDKVLEAITTKKCQENFHLESLEALGDSFLKYAASHQLFKTYQNNHEGLLSIKKDKIVSNAALCKLGCDRKLPGFIRYESFDPKEWVMPGYSLLKEELISNGRKMYIRGTRKVKSKSVADVVEALIGAFLSTGGEIAAMYFMNWVGIKVDVVHTPYESHFQVQPEKLVNIKDLESLLNYSFRNPCILVEALTHGSYMLPEIPGCYQRLEFLGDAVLDYLITIYLYSTYPGLSPGVLTDMRSASVNNDCYARSATKAGLHKHILHTSHKLHKEIVYTLENFERLYSESTFGWESETSFPKVLGDVIESLAGAIFVDSGYDKNIVFQSIYPLLQPLVTPETLRLHPVRELNEHCQQMHYDMKKPVKSRQNNVVAITVEVEANGVTLSSVPYDAFFFPNNKLHE